MGRCIGNMGERSRFEICENHHGQMIGEGASKIMVCTCRGVGGMGGIQGGRKNY